MKITRERLEQILREELTAVTEGERDYADNETEHTKDARGPLQKEGGAQGDYNPVGDAMRKLLRRNLTVQEFPADVMANIERSSMLKPMHYNVKGSHGGQKHHLVWNDGKELLYINLGKDWKPVMDQIMKNLGYTEDPYGAMPAIGESITEGMGQAFVKTIREMLEAAVEELGKMHETGSAEYKAAMETLRKEVKLALGKDDLQEAMHGDAPMMPPKAIKKKGIDVPLAKLADGAEAARAAVEAMYSPSSREYARAMMVIDMAEAQGALNEGELE